MANRGCHIIGVVSQVVSTARDQHTGRQVHGHGNIVRVQVGIERVLLVLLAVECFRQYKADLVLTGGVEHAADQCQGHDLQIRGSNSSRLGKPRISLNGRSVHGKHGTCTVTHHIAVAKLRFELRHQAIDVIHGCVDILQLLEHGHFRAQVVLNRKHNEAHLTEVNAEVPVKLLVSHDEAAAMDIDDHRGGDLNGVGTVHIHHMSRVTVLLVLDVPLLPDSILDLRGDVSGGCKLLEVFTLLIDDRFQYRIRKVSFHILQDIAACLRMHKGDRSVR